MAGIGHNNPPEPIEVPVLFGEKFSCLFGPEHYKGLHGGRGTGKSHAIATAVAIKMDQGHRRCVCARQFQNSIRDSSKEVIEQKIHALGLTPHFKIYEREIVHKYWESRATFVGLDRNPESIKSLEGGDLWWIEEARTINRRSLELLLPTIRKPGSEGIFSWNPEQPDDPVDDFFRGSYSRKTNPNWRPPTNSIVVPVGIEDNPWFYHTAMQDQMWHMAVGNPERYRHIWLGMYDETYDTKIFPNVIVRRIDVPKHITPRYGMDYSNGGASPFAVVKVYINHASKEIYIAREFLGNIDLTQLPAAIDSVIDTRSDEIVADSAQKIITDHLNANGFNVSSAIKAPHSVISGITWLQSYKLFIDPDCEEMREEARLYSWQVDRLTKKIKKIPVDEHNHLWDAVRYACEQDMIAPAEPDRYGGVIRLGARR